MFMFRAALLAFFLLLVEFSDCATNDWEGSLSRADRPRRTRQAVGQCETPVVIETNEPYNATLNEQASNLVAEQLQNMSTLYNLQGKFVLKNIVISNQGGFFSVEIIFVSVQDCGLLDEMLQIIVHFTKVTEIVYSCQCGPQKTIVKGG